MAYRTVLARQAGQSAEQNRPGYGYHRKEGTMYGYRARIGYTSPPSATEVFPYEFYRMVPRGARLRSQGDLLAHGFPTASFATGLRGRRAPQTTAVLLPHDPVLAAFSRMPGAGSSLCWPRAAQHEPAAGLAVASACGSYRSWWRTHSIL